MLHRDQLARQMARAYELGGEWFSPVRMEIDQAANCLSPVGVDNFARKDRLGNCKENLWDPGDQTPLRLIRLVRCRQCINCQRARAQMWYARAVAELFFAQRTWFGTLTLNPQRRFEAELKVRERMKRNGVSWVNLSRAERNFELHREYGTDLQRYFKRLRKEGYQFRYLVVSEEHKDGSLHYHALIHEKVGSKSLPKRSLERQWLHGFSVFRLVSDQDGVRYVCKYITKCSDARVRASEHYGREPPPMGIGRSHEPVNVRDETTPKTRGTTVTTRAKPDTAPSGAVLARFDLADTLDE